MTAVQECRTGDPAPKRRWAWMAPDPAPVGLPSAADLTDAGRRGWCDVHGTPLVHGTRVRRYGVSQDPTPGRVTALLDRDQVLMAWGEGARTIATASAVVVIASSEGEGRAVDTPGGDRPGPEILITSQAVLPHLWTRTGRIRGPQPIRKATPWTA